MKPSNVLELAVRFKENGMAHHLLVTVSVYTIPVEH